MQPAQLVKYLPLLEKSDSLKRYARAGGNFIYARILLLTLMLSGCATQSFQTLPVESLTFIERAITQS